MLSVREKEQTQCLTFFLTFELKKIQMLKKMCKKTCFAFMYSYDSFGQMFYYLFLGFGYIIFYIVI